jgi:hypothetical protein
MNELVKKCPIFTDPEDLWNLAQDSGTKRHLLCVLFVVYLMPRSIDRTQTTICDWFMENDELDWMWKEACLVFSQNFPLENYENRRAC